MSNSKAFEVDRKTVIDVGGYPYVVLPVFLRKEFGAKFGDQIVFKRVDADSPITIEVEKRRSKKSKS